MDIAKTVLLALINAIGVKGFVDLLAAVIASHPDRAVAEAALRAQYAAGDAALDAVEDAKFGKQS
jgi:hypothetical protein